MLIDTHCHIHDRRTYNYALSRQQVGKKLLRKYPDLPHEPEDFLPEKIIARAHEADVKKMVCIGTSHEDSMEACEFATKYANEGIYWTYGIHPDETNAKSEYRSPSPLLLMDSLPDIPAITTGPEKRRFQRLVAIGEVGLDYRDGEANRIAQIKLFEQMLQLAHDNDLPVVLHIREAFDDLFAVLENFPETRGVVHSFSDSLDNLKKSLNKGFYIGVNGLATFAPEIPLPPLEKMLLETDAPFLTPSPFRGTINEPAHIRDVCAHISKLMGESEAHVAEITTKNAEQLFRL